MTRPKFLFFDIGNVLLFFDHRIACRQVAALVGSTEQRIWDLLFASGLELRYEQGELSTPEFYEEFCRVTESRPTIEQVAYATSAIFEINTPVHAIVGHLRRAGHRLGLLSNTSEMHWDYFTSGRYGIIPGAFEVHAASFRLQALKPQRAIYERAAALAGVAPEEAFFVDDIATHVEGARAAGFDAVQFTTPRQLTADLAARGIHINW
ncbi:MAG: HAD family phosphatase [Pirellulales bacterium]|nr:HAD family phosphatase [Pirellulales bacterium]